MSVTHPDGHIDVRRLGLSLWDMVPLIVCVVSVVALYFSITKQIDDLKGSVTSAVESLKEVRESSIAKSEFDNWCLKAQIVNPNWRCPLVSGNGTIAPRQRPTAARVSRPPDKTTAAQ